MKRIIPLFMIIMIVFSGIVVAQKTFRIQDASGGDFVRIGSDGSFNVTNDLKILGNVNITGTLNASGRISFPNLASCDTIDTDANGVLTCGTDSGTIGSGDFTNNTDINVTNFVANNTLFVNGSRVGILTDTPTSALDVAGAITVNYQEGLFSRYSTGDAIQAFEVDTGALGIVNSILNTHIFAPTLNGWQIGTANSYISGRVGNSPDNGISIGTDGNEIIRIATSGFVGINTTNPNAIFEINQSEDSEFIRLTDGTNADHVGIYSGAGSPEGVVSAQIGSLYMDNSGGALYKKESDGGSGNWFEVQTFNGSNQHMAKMTLSSSQSIDNNAAEKILLDTVNFTRGGIIASTETSSINITKAGTYLANAHWHVALAANDQPAYAEIYLNGELIAADGSSYASVNNVGVGTVTVLDLVPGDALEMYVYQNSGASRPTLTGKASKPTFSVIQIDPNLAAAGGWSDTGDTIELQNSADDISANTLIVNNTNGSVQVKGNFSVDSNTFYVDENTNRVGIGTEEPDSTLKVVGDVNFTETVWSQGVNITAVGTGTFTNNSDINVTSFVANNTLFINGSKVGFGTALPDTEVKVVGDINITGTVWSQGINITNLGNDSSSSTLSNIVFFTEDGNWTKPANLDYIIVEVWGGGGAGGAGVGNVGGSGGGYAKRRLSFSELNVTETVIIGTGGTAAGAGGDSRFGIITNATGGGGNGGTPGTGKGGDLNLTGIGGNFGISAATIGAGGHAPFMPGGGAGGGGVISGTANTGGGGTSGGGNGGSGLVVIYEYTYSHVVAGGWEDQGDVIQTKDNTDSVGMNSLVVNNSKNVVTVSGILNMTADSAWLNGVNLSDLGGGSGTFTNGSDITVKDLEVDGNLTLAANNSYINFGNVSGEPGWGIRDNGGILQVKNVNGTWLNLGGGRTTLSAVRNFTSGTNVAYNPPENVDYIIVELWGAGAGGSGSGTASATDGTDGGDSCFGTNSVACSGYIMNATGGKHGVWATVGTGGVGGSGYGGDVVLSGSGGGGETDAFSGGTGGNAPRGGGGGRSNFGNNAGTGEDFGGGGAGGGTDVATSEFTGPGGGAGGYTMKVITNPVDTYYYTIGAGGSGGSAGTSGFAGGAGGAGGIVIHEYVMAAAVTQGEVKPGNEGRLAFFDDKSGNTSIDDASGLYWNESSSKFGVGTAALDTLFKAAGDINITGTVWSQGVNITAAGTGTFQNGSDIWTRFLGINTTEPNAYLEINASEDSEFIRLTDDTNADHVGIYSGAGSPEGVITAQIGSLYMDNSGGALYKKEQDGGSAGWFEVSAHNGSNQHMAKMTRDAAQTIESGAEEHIQFDTVELATGIVTDTSGNYSFNITKAGTYFVTTNLQVLDVDDNEAAIVYIQKNSEIVNLGKFLSTGLDENLYVHTNTILELVPGDFISMHVFHNEGGSLSTSTQVQNKPTMSIVQLDPNLAAAGGWSDTGDTIELQNSGDSISANSLVVNNTLFQVKVAGELNVTSPTIWSNGVNISAGVGSGTFTNNSDINVTNFVANNTLFINGSRVGIGTALPDTEVKVVGDINITGTIWSQGINITNLGNDSSSSTLSNIVMFTGNGSWTKPTNLDYIIVEVWGGGGAGGPVVTDQGGSGGGYAKRRLTASELNITENVSVGDGGESSGAGQDSRFGVLVNATGGAADGGAAGTGKGGDVNLTGGVGNVGVSGATVGPGGNAPFMGGAGKAGSFGSGGVDGTGGGGATSSPGGSGLIIIYEYTYSHVIAGGWEDQGDVIQIKDSSDSVGMNSLVVNNSKNVVTVSGVLNMTADSAWLNGVNLSDLGGGGTFQNGSDIWTRFLGINTTQPNAYLEINASEDSEFIRLTDGTNADHVGIYSGSGSPEGVVTAQIGSLYMDNSGGALYKKESDGGTAGWFELQSFNGSNQHMAKMVRAAAQNIPNAADTHIAFDQVNFSTGIIADTSGNYSFNITKAGTYLVTASWSAQNIDDVEAAITYILKNNEYVAHSRLYSSGANELLEVPVTTVLELVPGDTLTMQVYHDEDSDQNTLTQVEFRPTMSVIQLDPNLAAAGGWSDTGDTIELQNSGDSISANSLVVNNTLFQVKVAGELNVTSPTIWSNGVNISAGVGSGTFTNGSDIEVRNLNVTDTLWLNDINMSAVINSTGASLSAIRVYDMNDSWNRSSNIAYIVVEVWGAGGGGGGDSSTAGGTGGISCFGTNENDACDVPIVNATGGLGGQPSGGAAAANGGIGGSGGTGYDGDIVLVGQPGMKGGELGQSGTSSASGTGGSAPLGGGGGNLGSDGSPKGGGGGGASSSNTAGSGGGGGGGYSKKFIQDPLDTYWIGVGEGGSAGTGSRNGGKGGNGSVIVYEYSYNPGSSTGGGWLDNGDTVKLLTPADEVDMNGIVVNNTQGVVTVDGILNVTGDSAWLNGVNLSDLGGGGTFQNGSDIWTRFLGINTTQPNAYLEINASEDSEFIRLTDGTNADHVGIYSGSGSPEGVVTAQIGSLYMDNNGGALYKKEQDGGSAGWFEVSAHNGSNQHMAKMTRSAAQLIDSATTTTIDFDTINFSTGITADSVANTFNITKAGKYLVTTRWFAQGIDDTEYADVYLYVNSNIAAVGRIWGSTTNADSYVSVAEVFDLAPGDYVYMRVYQTSGDQQNTGTTEATEPTMSVIEIDPDLAAAGGWSDVGDTVELQNSADDISANTLVVNNTNGSVQVKGNFSVDSNTLYVDENTNRVGIGTDGPSNELSIQSSSADVNVADFVGDGGSGIMLNVYSDSGGSGISNAAGFTDEGIYMYTSSGGGIQFYTAGSNTVSIDSTGDLGLGTTTPSEKLTVIGNVNISGTLNVSGRIAFPNLASCDTIDTDANGVLTCGTDRTTLGGDDVSGSGAAGYIVLWNETNAMNESRIYQDAQGEIGIGTNSPAGYLDVATGSGVELLFSGAATANIYQSIASQGLFLNSNAGPIFIGSGGSGDSDISITSEGDVGIGTTAPSQELELVGNFSVKGGGFFVDNESQSVGIGTAEPTEALTITGNVSTTETNNTMGSFQMFEYNSTCAGFRFGVTGGVILSCA